MLRHLPLLTDPQYLEGFLLRGQRDPLNMQLERDPAQLRAVVTVVHTQLPQAAWVQGDRHEGPEAALGLQLASKAAPPQTWCLPRTRQESAPATRSACWRAPAASQPCGLPTCDERRVLRRIPAGGTLSCWIQSWQRTDHETKAPGLLFRAPFCSPTSLLGIPVTPPKGLGGSKEKAGMAVEY